MHILSISDTGFEQILVSEQKASDIVLKLYKEHDFKSMKTLDMIKFILNYQELLKTPIVFDEHKLLIGFNDEEIRKFLPRYRQL